MSNVFHIDNLRLMKPVCGVYAIVGPNGRRYIGSSQDAAKRLRGHWRALMKGEHHCVFLQRAWIKYDRQGFTCEMLCELPVEMLISAEQHWMDYHRSRSSIYNTSPIAGTQRGFRHSIETRALLSKQRIGNKATFGYKPTEETRAKLRAKRNGRKPSLGMVMSPSHKAAIVAANTGRRKSAEERAKISATLKSVLASRKELQP